MLKIAFVRRGKNFNYSPFVHARLMQRTLGLLAGSMLLFSFAAPSLSAATLTLTSGDMPILTTLTPETFTGNTTLTGNLTVSVGAFEYLVVGGGGAGGAGAGGGNFYGGGGGGGGGVSAGTFNVDNTSFGVVVGIGGSGSSGNGGNGGQSSIAGVTSANGGIGGRVGNNGSGNNGGNSGSPSSKTGGSGSNSGTHGGGGGGAGAGVNGGNGASGGGSGAGGNGGAGVSSNITNASLFYGGGGGGAGGAGTGTPSGGSGGAGGGGNGGRARQGNNTGGGGGAANSGGGGGGSGFNFSGGNGGSGVVVIRYFGETDAADGGTETAVGTSFRYNRFTGSGSLTNLTSPTSQVAIFSGDLTGGFGLTKDAAGTLILTGTNSYTTTTITAGTLQIGDGASTGTLGSSDVVNDAALVFNRVNTLSVNNVISGTGTVTQNGVGTVEFAGVSANSYSGVTTINAGTLALNKSSGVVAAAGDGNPATADVQIAGGTLRHDSNEQIANTASVDMTSGAWNLNGRTETIHDFANSGGNFVTGQNGNLTGLGNTITWSGGTNTINAGGAVNDQHFDISGGTNVVEGDGGSTFGGGTLNVQAGGIGLEFTGSGTPNLTLNSDALSPGRLLLNGDLTVAATYSGSGASIVTGGTAAVPGTIDLAGTPRNFIIHDSAAAPIDLDITARIANGGIIKTGAGVLRLTGDNTYTGDTVLNGGVIDLAGGTLQNANTYLQSGNFEQTGGVNNVTAAGAGNHLTVAAGTTYALSGGTLNFGDYADMNQTVANGPSTLAINVGGTFSLTADGRLENVTNIDPSADVAGVGGTFTQNGGTLVIGVDGVNPNDPLATRAVTNILGNFTQTSGTLAIDIFGADDVYSGEVGGSAVIVDTDSDLLNVSGDLVLSGTLAINTNGIQLPPFAWFDVAFADSITLTPGSFQITGVNLYQILNNPNGGQILQVAIPEPSAILLWGLLGIVGLRAVRFVRRRR